MTAYREFAALYDALMDDVDYDAWAAHYMQLLNAEKSARVAELGCGTGQMTVRFAKAGYNILGTDISQDMIARAQQRARAWGVAACAFAVQDMARIALPRRVQAIFCACDGVNYLTDLPSVARCFGGVHASLVPGGTFAFDISAPHKLESMAGQMYGEDREDITYLWINDYDKATRRMDMALTFFTKQGDSLYRRFDERHVQRAHTVTELIEALQAAGFEGIQAYSGMTDKPWTQMDERVHFVARKGF